MRSPGMSRRGAAITRSTSIGRTPSLSQRDAPDMAGLRPYQREGVLWLRSRRNALLGDAPGVGKTVQALRALERGARAVVVCPASVVLQWKDEGERWRPDLRFAVGEPLRRPGAGEVLIVSYDSLPEPPPHSFRLVAEDMGDVTLVADEIQLCKSDDARRTSRFRRLRAQCGRCWGLSGTPMLGTPPDLWGVLVSLGLSHVYGDRDAFVAMCGGKERWMRDKRTGRPKRIGYDWGEVSDEVRETLLTVMLRRGLEDIGAQLPSVQLVDVPVEAPEDLRDHLDEVKAGWDEVGPGDLPPFELLSEAMTALARSKTAAAAEQASLMAESYPLLVFSAHRDPVLGVVEAMPKKAAAITGDTPLAERRALVERFASGKLRVLAMTIQAGGTGIDGLQRAAGGVLFVDRSYSPSENDQAVARARRSGQKREMLVVARMVSDHPLDRRLCQILDEKSRLVGAVVG